jgi:hypothetical protein
MTLLTAALAPAYSPGSRSTSFAAFAVLLGIGLGVGATWSLIVGIGTDIMPGDNARRNGRKPGSWLLSKTDLALHLGSYRMAGKCPELQTTRESANEQQIRRSGRT